MKAKIFTVVLSAFLAVSVMGAREHSRFFFVQISDPQLGFTAGNDNIGPDVESLKIAVSHINRLRPAFVVVSGDMVNASKNKKQWAVYSELISGIDKTIPVYHIPGNHDIGKAGPEHTGHVEAYKDRMGDDRFSFIYNGCLFAGMNSSIVRDGNGPLEAGQFKWLGKVLKKKAKFKMVFTHCPVFRKDFDEKEDYSNFSKTDREKYWNLFVSRKVDAVSAGHLHYSRRASHEGIDMISVGSLSRPLGKGVSGLGIYIIDPDGPDFQYEYYPLTEVPQTININ